MKEYERS